MRTLIDGYNVMFAGGLMGQRFGPDVFRKVRNRFLNDVAAALNPIEAQYTTIVFDASQPPPDRPSSIRHKGMTIVYAVEAESADEQIEILVAGHSSPKTLTVVSSDHRVQRAATRRRAKVMSADDYWNQMDSRKNRKPIPPLKLANPDASDPDRPGAPSAMEAAYWMAEFRDLADSDEVRAVSRGDLAFPTDDEIARIAREVAAEAPVRRLR
jgi:predicted RNA-binding protein with PIN domain